jgi:hypothetical protein
MGVASYADRIVYLRDGQIERMEGTGNGTQGTGQSQHYLEDRANHQLEPLPGNVER